jgi:hypothetical protein
MRLSIGSGKDAARDEYEEVARQGLVYCPIRWQRCNSGSSEKEVNRY